ncbi:uncharacterized protein LOC109606274 isoform X2 [Aethina tumida]|uniref:uncharacterized protein LOC109606274 isoform X2 n=1 Tax=Aethina tumida TaxID=116153 RepID=UPI00214981E7|nr:uncharacterized protein LOC109606274 isoform X2 [Aethina tumida]
MKTFIVLLTFCIVSGFAGSLRPKRRPIDPDIIKAISYVIKNDVEVGSSSEEDISSDDHVTFLSPLTTSTNDGDVMTFLMNNDISGNEKYGSKSGNDNTLKKKLPLILNLVNTLTGSPVQTSDINKIVDITKELLEIFQINIGQSPSINVVPDINKIIDVLKKLLEIFHINIGEEFYEYRKILKTILKNIIKYL